MYKQIHGLKLTEIEDSAPRLRSRKRDAESWDATTIIIGLRGSLEETFIGGKEDHTLPFRCQKHFIIQLEKHKNLRSK